jgi:hypothetical protein
MIRLKRSLNPNLFLSALMLVLLAACAAPGTTDYYHDPNMDFSAIRTVAVMPFANLTRDKLAGERVRDTFMTGLMSTGVIYVIPPGEVARGISRLGLADPTAPAGDEITKLLAIIRADAVITGTVREFGEVKSGTASANVISVSMQMIEKESRKVVWSASATKGGISFWDRLFGAGGRPMEDVTEAAINEIINKLFY